MWKSPTGIQSKTECIQRLTTEYNTLEKVTYILEVLRKFRTVGTEGLEMKGPMYMTLGKKGGVFTPLRSAQIPN